MKKKADLENDTERVCLRMSLSRRSRISVGATVCMPGLNAVNRLQGYSQARKDK